MVRANMMLTTTFFSSIFILVNLFLPFKVLAEDTLFNWGNFWNNMSKRERVVFLIGYEEGYQEGKYDAFGEIINPGHKKMDVKNMPENMKQTIRKIANLYALKKFDITTICDLVSNFYKEPANSYLMFGTIKSIAIKKLEGMPSNNIERELQSARQTMKVIKELKFRTPELVRSG